MACTDTAAGAAAQHTAVLAVWAVLHITDVGKLTSHEWRVPEHGVVSEGVRKGGRGRSGSLPLSSPSLQFPHPLSLSLSFLPPLAFAVCTQLRRCHQ